MNEIRALIVEDDQNFAKIVERALKESGYSVMLTSSSEEALVVAEQFTPHVAVIDIRLPGEHDGVELCQRLRKAPAYNDLIIVMMTAYDMRKEADRSIMAGADILIPKPFSPKKFREQVESLVKDKRRKL